MKFRQEFKPSTIREGRRAKEAAREKNISLSRGQSRAYQELVVPKIEQRIAEAVNEHKDWIESEFIKSGLGAEKSISLGKVLAIFQKTLERRLKQYAHLRGMNPETAGEDSSTITLLLEQTAFDFMQSLRQSVRRGDTPKRALKFAGLSHWIDPHTIERLSEKYEDRVNKSVISSAILSHHRNPDAFIDLYLETVKRLNEKYKDRVNQHVIDHAALNHSKNPDAFVDSYLEAIKRLNKKYKGLANKAIIDHAALNHSKNPDAFVDSYLEAVKHLSKKYKGHVIKDVIKRAASYYRKNPDAFIESYIKTVKRLSEKYKGQINEDVIRQAPFHNSKNPETFVDWFIDAEKHLLTIEPRRSIVYKFLFSNIGKPKDELSRLMTEKQKNI